MPLGRCPSDLVGNVTTTAGEFTASMRSQPAPGCCRSRHGTVFISRVRSAGSVTRWLDQVGHLHLVGRAQRGERLPDEARQPGVDVGGQVGDRPGQPHPGPGQRVEPAGQVPDGGRGVDPAEDLLVERGQVGQPLPGRGVHGQGRAERVPDGLLVAAGPGGAQLAQHPLVVRRGAGQVGAVDLVQAALGALDGLGDVALGRQQRPGREAAHGDRCDGGVTPAPGQRGLHRAQVLLGPGVGHWAPSLGRVPGRAVA